MPYEGQPIPTTTYPSNRAKVGDGKSVRVTVPENTTVAAGGIYELDGFVGIAVQGAVTGAGETDEVVLNIEQAEFETDQISTSQDFVKGTKIYYNPTTKKLTETSESGDTTPVPYRSVGIVTNAKDANNVIHFILGPQV